jgi:DNA adenine methylase
MPISRPALRWHGGKYLLAERILAFFPPHRCYTETFGGAASILLQKPRAHAEVYNDLDDQVVGLFRVLQDPASATRLIELLRLTPFARREFQIAYDVTDDPIEAARRLVIRSFMGFGSNAHSATARGHRSTGFRSNSNRSGTTPARDWANYPDALPAIIERLQGVVIENRDALTLMCRHDGAQTLHYVDPPYLQETRRREHMYRHEMTAKDHIKLLAGLRKLAGMVVLSGYASDLYDQRLKTWERIEIPSFADGARPRIEVLWLNPTCAAALKPVRAGQGTPLFPLLLVGRG